jgi:hypothetical protein
MCEKQYKRKNTKGRIEKELHKSWSYRDGGNLPEILGEVCIQVQLECLIVAPF